MITPHLNTLFLFCLITFDAAIWSRSHVITGITPFYSAPLPYHLVNILFYYICNPIQSHVTFITCTNYLLLTLIVIVQPI